MKIYTKSGDKGETSLLGGKRVKKYHLRIQAYGTCDELNAWIGLLRDQEISTNYKEILIKIQNVLFTIGSHLALIGLRNDQRLGYIKHQSSFTVSRSTSNNSNFLPCHPSS